MEYHKTKDLLRVQRSLGHKQIKSTMVHTPLISLEGDECNSATAETVEEAARLVEAGFEYVCEVSEVKLS